MNLSPPAFDPVSTYAAQASPAAWAATQAASLAQAQASGDVGGYIAGLAEPEQLEQFLGDVDSAIARGVGDAQDPQGRVLLGEVRDGLRDYPANELPRAERDRLEGTLSRLDRHLDADGAGQVPGGGLDAHEDAGGHLIERHVGKTAGELLDRLQRENISASSSFRTLADAERFVAQTLDQNQPAIDAWLDGEGGRRLVVDARFDASTGISVQRGEREAEDVFSVKLVLERSDKLDIGYRIVTGYPTAP